MLKKLKKKNLVKKKKEKLKENVSVLVLDDSGNSPS